MGVGAGLYMYVVVVQKFTFTVSSPDEFLFLLAMPSSKRGRYTCFMAQMMWFHPRTVLFGVRMISYIISGKCAPNPPKKGRE